MAQWARDLSGEDFTGFSPLGSQFGEDSSTLNASLSGVSRKLTALNSEISDASTVLLADLRAVNSQFMEGMNLFLNVLNNTQNVDYTDAFEDVSEESLQSAARGKVLECDNYGAATADRSAGGIAGSGSRVRDCISMVEITDCTQLAGAVAGEVTGEYCGNRFVSDTLTAIAAVITLVIRKRRAKAAKCAQ